MQALPGARKYEQILIFLYVRCRTDLAGSKGLRNNKLNMFMLSKLVLFLERKKAHSPSIQADCKGVMYELNF